MICAFTELYVFHPALEWYEITACLHLPIQPEQSVLKARNANTNTISVHAVTLYLLLAITVHMHLASLIGS